mmetsp:Transcript_573/g.1092  ORF Transcript_573/g.1092 Transcript_573/m.1092 type:complete len:233 (-) Transcript_573:28-726(-)
MKLFNSILGLFFLSLPLPGAAVLTPDEFHRALVLRIADNAKKANGMAARRELEGCYLDEEQDYTFPVCPGEPSENYCDGDGDCGSAWCDCQVGQDFCSWGDNPCSSGGGGDDESVDEGISAHVHLLCAMFETFDLNGRYENNDRTIPGFEWPTLCDDFEPLDPYLCPWDDVVDAICDRPHPDSNNAMRLGYCEPIASFIVDNDEYRDGCIKWCINYVSQNRGGCCDAMSCPA